MTLINQVFDFWTTLSGPLAFTAALVILPGLVVGLAAGLRGFLALGFAPLLSVFAVSVGAIVGGAIGTPWGLGAPAATAAVVAVLALAARGVLRRRLAEVTWLDTPDVTRPSAQATLMALAGALLGAALLLRHARGMLQRPDAFSQTFDNIFHLNLIRYIVAQGDASSLTVTTMTNGPDSTSFYPAAFHGLASLTLQAFPTSMAVATNAVTIVIMAVVWPLSCLTLVLLLTRGDTPTLLATGVLSASFSAFPVLLASFGVLYPNLLGLALLPPVVGLTAQALAVSPVQRITPLGATALGAIGLVTLLIAHPNVVVSLFAIAIAPLLLRIAREARNVVEDGDLPITWVSLAIPVLVLTVILIAWGLMRPPAAEWGPPLDHAGAVFEVLVNGHLGDAPAWVASAFVLVGLAVAVRNRLGWASASWLTVAFLWFVVASLPVSDFRDALTAPWYNDSFRLAALVPTLAVPLAAIGFGAVAAWGLRRARTAGGATAVLGGLLAVLLVGTQFTAAMGKAVEHASLNYALTPKSPLVTTDEYALLMRLPSVVGDAAVVTNPWNGSSMAFALAGVRTTGTHVFTWTSPDESLVNNKLDEVATDKRVCPALERLGAGYALDFGTREIHGGHNPYPGLDALAGARGFKVADREGTAVLYRVTACG